MTFYNNLGYVRPNVPELDGDFVIDLAKSTLLKTVKTLVSSSNQKEEGSFTRIWAWVIPIRLCSVGWSKTGRLLGPTSLALGSNRLAGLWPAKW